MSEFKTGKINKHVLYSNILNRDVTLSIYLQNLIINLLNIMSFFALTD